MYLRNDITQLPVQLHSHFSSSNVIQVDLSGNCSKSTQ